MSTVIVRTDNIPIDVPTDNIVVVQNLGPDDLLFGDSPAFTPDTKVGTVLVGQAQSFLTPHWMRCLSSTTVVVTSSQGAASHAVIDDALTPVEIDSTGVADTNVLVFNAVSGRFKPGSGVGTQPGSMNGLNVLTYGAKGDGITDDTTPIQAAVNAAGALYASTGAVTSVILPSGYKFFMGQITVTSGVRFSAYGASIKPHVNFNNYLLKYPNGSIPTVLKDFEICGGYWLGTGNEINSNGLFCTQNLVGCQDVVLRDMYITNWGVPPLLFQNPTNVKVLNNTIYCNDINNKGNFQNCISFDFYNTPPSGGHIIVDGNRIHNSTADAISAVIISTSISQPLNFIVTNNICTCDLPVTDAAAVFNATSTVASTNATTANVGKYVVGTGVPAPAYIVSAVNGVSYTLSKVSTFTGAGTLDVGVYRNCIWLEVDNAAAGGVSNAIFANNIVQTTERAGMGLSSGSTYPISQAVVANNIVTNTQLNAAANTTNASDPQGAAFSVVGNSPTLDDIAITENYFLCASPTVAGVRPYHFQPKSNGPIHGNKFSAGQMQGKATLVAGTVTISTTEIQTGDTVLLSVVAPAGTRGMVQLGTITAGTSFVINSVQPGTASTVQAADTSTVFWQIVH